MKRFLLLISIVVIQQIKGQTYVAIPDSNLVHCLKAIVPTAFKGDSLDISNALVTTFTTKIDAYNLSITNFEGIQYFTSLDSLDCSYNSSTSIPALPNSLTYLNCSANFF